MKITCTIPTLGHGGAQKVLRGIANRLVEHGHSVEIVTFAGPLFPTVYDPDRAVSVTHLGESDKRPAKGFKILILFKRLRLHILTAKPDIILSFQEASNIPTLISLIGCDYKIVVAERSDPKAVAFFRIRMLLREFLYRKASKIVVQTTAIAKQFSDRYTASIEIIPNACPKVQNFAHPGQKDGNRYKIVCLGRLHKVKGHANLINAAALVLPRFPQWKLEIYGTGAEELTLRQQIIELNLEGNVFLKGQSNNALHDLQGANLFVFPSLYEGFPNALAEAVAVGLPVIAYESVSGVTELVEQNVNGILLNSTRSRQELAQALESLMENPQRREVLGKESLKIAKRFDSESILVQWESLLLYIHNVCSKNSS